MLISFSVENWMSFKEKATLSMVASREKQHKERVPEFPKYRAKILPVAAIYGGNASGKTNLVSAINFAKNFITSRNAMDDLILTKPFLLNSTNTTSPTLFSFEILIDEKLYTYQFSVTKNKVISEELLEILSNSKKSLYRRDNSKIEFQGKLKKDKRLKFIAEGTRNNELFLTNAVSQKIEDFRFIFDWFKNSLQTFGVFQKSKFGFSIGDYYEKNEFKNLITQLDTGISNLEMEKLSSKDIFDENMYKIILDWVNEGESIKWSASNQGEVVVAKKNGILEISRLITYHTDENGDEIKFSQFQESHGTQKIIDVLPAFLDLCDSNAKKTYIFDEIGLHLHSLLTKQLLSYYLSKCSPETRNQFIFTTHDVILMDQDLLRRDEIWVTERDQTGNSTLFSFSDYKDVRADKDIQKSYLQGRLGCIPRLLLGDLINNG